MYAKVFLQDVLATSGHVTNIDRQPGVVVSKCHNMNRIGPLARWKNKKNGIGIDQDARVARSVINKSI